MSLRAKSNANFQRLPAQKGSYSGTSRLRFYSGEALYLLKNGFSKLQNYCTKSFIIEPPKLGPTVTYFGFIFSENRWNVLKVGQHVPISYCPKGWASIYWTAEKCLNWQKNPYPNFWLAKWNARYYVYTIRLMSYFTAERTLYLEQNLRGADFMLIEGKITKILKQLE